MIWFEDNSSKVISNFIKSKCSVDVDFLDGNKNRDKLIGTSGILFVDVVPDNFDTIDSHNMLKDYIRKNNLDIVVIPIVCIEYIILKAFSTRSIPYIANLSNYKDYIIKQPSSQTLSTKSLEKFCKSVLHHAEICIRENSALFYNVDCLCTKQYYQDSRCRNVPIDSKVLLLTKMLPLDIENLDLYSKEDIVSIQESCIAQYYVLANEFVNSGYIINVKDLN